MSTESATRKNTAAFSNFAKPAKLPVKGAKMEKYYYGSGRSIGKMTNVLLLGLCQRKEYGTTILYVRSQETEFTPTEAKHLTSVISSYNDGQYIKKLTDNRYNTIIYKARAFYYAWVDENGDITDKEAEECIRVLTVDRGSKRDTADV